MGVQLPLLSLRARLSEQQHRGRGGGATRSLDVGAHRRTAGTERYSKAFSQGHYEIEEAQVAHWSVFPRRSSFVNRSRRLSPEGSLSNGAVMEKSIPLRKIVQVVFAIVVSLTARSSR